MHRGLRYGVIAFGLTVGLGAFGYTVWQGMSVGRAAFVACLLISGLVAYPLARVGGGRPRGGRRETAGVALIVFGLLTAALAVIVGYVGRGPWLRPVLWLFGASVLFAAAGALVLWGGARGHARRAAQDSETMRWRE